MARYASGKKAWGYSDRSGFRYRLRDIKEWNGLKVGIDEYEPKHPQLEPDVQNWIQQLYTKTRLKIRSDRRELVNLKSIFIWFLWKCLL